MGALTIGTDLVHLPDLRRQLADAASTFIAGTFTSAELRAATLRANARHTGPDHHDPDLAPHLGARFAAKEAFLKAWDQRFWGAAPPIASTAIDHRDIEVVTDAWGRPKLVLHNDIARVLGPLRAEVSLSHDGPFASAVVLLHEVQP